MPHRRAPRRLTLRHSSSRSGAAVADVAQLVERQVVVLDVAGSSPVVRPTPAPTASPAGYGVLILAGGRGRRLGGLDKPLLRLHGTTLLHRILARLPAHAVVALSANGDASRFAAYGLTVLADWLPDQGPLGGVLRGLDWAHGRGCEALLTVPGDTPFIPLDLASRLLPAPALAVSDGRLHHAVASWPTACREALRTHLGAGGSRSVRRFAETLPMRRERFALGAVDPFFNINTPDELRRAEAIAAATPSPAVPPPG